MMAFFENYSDVVNQLQAFGLVVDELRVDTTRPVRCGVDLGLCPVDNAKRKSAGWYHLASFVVDSKTYIVGAFGFWKGADNNLQKVEWDKTVTVTPEQKKAQAERFKQMKIASEKARAEEIEAASRRAVWIWSKYTRQGQCDYLDRKQVGAHGVRFGPKDTVAVPVANASGKIFGLQFIRSDAAIKGTKKIQKKFEPQGMAISGHFHLIGQPREVCLIAEGYATAATLHEVTGLPVAVAFNANNLTPVAKEIKKHYPNAVIVVCADDDYLQKCTQCHKPTRVNNPFCENCGQPHNTHNPGVHQAEKAVNTVGGRFVKPDFVVNDVDIRNGEKLTDFNDLALHPQGGHHLVRAQVDAALQGLEIKSATATATAVAPIQGAGDERNAAVSTMSLDDLMDRFIYIDDETGDFVFDTWTQNLAKFSKVTKMLPAGIRTDDIKRHPVWNSRAVYIDQIGFDPTEKDKNIVCNRWNGWPTKPNTNATEKDCEKLLSLLMYLCSNEESDTDVFKWILSWMAYPIQNPGAKMHSALVMHGPQGTGKSLVWETYCKIFGEYGTIMNQGAIEDKFNSDWAERKLFIVADEIVARAEMHHIKNQLKGMITGEWIRVNPKNLAAHKERNHINLVFLSNEHQPVVLENDDRRHCVVYTPKKLDPQFYDDVNTEIANGGAEALHQFLLNFDLGDFKPWTKPPKTKAKDDLIEINLDSPQIFINEYLSGDLGLPIGPMRSSDFYNQYLAWCKKNGEKFPRANKQFVPYIKNLGWYVGHKDAFDSYHWTNKKRVRVFIPSEEDNTKAELNGCQIIRKTAGHTEAQYITDGILQYLKAVNGGLGDENGY